MLRRLIAWLNGPPKPVTPDFLAIACARKDIARRAYIDAVRRGDTRDIHHAHLRHKRATTAHLAAELGR